MVPLQLPLLGMMLMKQLRKVKENILTKNKQKMSGVVNCVNSEELYFDKVKTLSKQLGITINDLVTSSISTGLY